MVAINNEDLCDLIRGKRPPEQLAVAQRILDAVQRNVYPASNDERRALNNVVTKIKQRMPIPDELMMEFNTITRQFMQHLLARG